VTSERLTHKLIILLLLLPVLLLTSCSSSKNTWRERAIQSMNTRYNVYFNGKKSYDEGLQAILLASKDNYGSIIHMYPISVHSNATVASSQMTRAIEKSRKAIKTRSIKEKPQINPSRRTDPKYRAFIQQEEFNPFMKNVWLLLAKAEFHKADFLGSIGTFNYIIRHFPEDMDLQMTCQLWVVRAYAEMGWLYEAEEMLRQINPSNIRNENTGLFAAVRADLLLKQKLYKEAIPFLEMALNFEKDRRMRMRFTFLLAQLYDISGDKQASHDAYSKVLSASPPYDMDLNARINRAALFIQRTSDTRRELQRMVRNNNNADYLDQLFYTIGLSYLHDRDTVKAITNFQTAIDESTRNGVDKAKVLIHLADLLYDRKEYVKAQPNYDEASKIIMVDHEEYPRVSRRAELLAEFLVEYTMVQLQDSLQRLSAMTPEQRLETILEYIAWQEREEKLAAEREESKLAKAANQEPRLDPMAGLPQIGGRNPANEWYFYNPNALRTGQQEFQRRWGKRRLEDNWRRVNKSAAMFADENTTDSFEDIEQVTDSVTGEVLAIADQVPDSVASDRKNPEFYLRQIPVTPAQLELSNELWAESLFKMGIIYKDKLEDYPMAIETFDEYVRRFGTRHLASDALFNNYLVYSKTGQGAAAEQVRVKLVDNYPDTRYGKLLTDRDFLKNRQQMFEQQDSLYNIAYKAFNASEFARVRQFTDSVRERYPTSTLMPKFLFIKALSVAKTGDQATFEKELNELLEEFPQSDVSAMTKDMLALMKQGRESMQGSSHGTILARREAELNPKAENDSVKMNFSAERGGPHRLLFLSEASQPDLFALQFNLAVYNFSKFLIKDFELTVTAVEGYLNAVSVYEFEDFEEAEWYVESVIADEAVNLQLANLKVRPLIISSGNYQLLRAGKKVYEYIDFINNVPTDAADTSEFEDDNVEVTKESEDSSIEVLDEETVETEELLLEETVETEELLSDENAIVEESENIQE
jgi:tetratricopeptide (TPR) repeat protein